MSALSGISNTISKACRDPLAFCLFYLLHPCSGQDIEGELFIPQETKRKREEKKRKKEQENCNFCVAVLHISAFLTKKKYFILTSFLKISFVHCHWRTTLLIYLKYLC